MTGYQIPIELVSPQAFVFHSAINEDQAYTQAGAYKGKAFGLNLGRFLRRSKTSTEVKLLERRLVPFWYVQCASQFDFDILNTYEIKPRHPDVTQLTLQGNDQQVVTFTTSRVAATGAAPLTISGSERCITRRDNSSWIDSYHFRPNLLPVEYDKEQTRMQAYAVHPPHSIADPTSFATTLHVQEQPLFQDDVKTTVMLPYESVADVLRRALGEVMITDDVSLIHEASVAVTKCELYFRPVFVFEFEKTDEQGTVVDSKLWELDGLDRERWTALTSLDYEAPQRPFPEVMQIPADFAERLGQDVALAGATFVIPA